ncbi:hypothetical protein ACH49M_12475 [Rhodococcus qingshengii]|uniref:hypothetical protein n=1 Tax=Rhodococcus qingshengii TaxID=334542 RepID=UPI003700E0FE
MEIRERLQRLSNIKSEIPRISMFERFRGEIKKKGSQGEDLYYEDTEEALVKGLGKGALYYDGGASVLAGAPILDEGKRNKSNAAFRKTVDDLRPLVRRRAESLKMKNLPGSNG